MTPEAESKEIKHNAGCAVAVIGISLLFVGAFVVAGARYPAATVIGSLFVVVVWIRWLAKPAPEPKAWRCESCTAMNRAEVRVCAGCDKERETA